jgi:uncharacterized protein YybS (DUF2232 family)
MANESTKEKPDPTHAFVAFLVAMVVFAAIWMWCDRHIIRPVDHALNDTVQSLDEVIAAGKEAEKAIDDAQKEFTRLDREGMGY